jgi:hypothetical protein
MPDIAYQYRPNIFRKLETYTLSSGVLYAPTAEIPLATIRCIRFYTLPGMTSLAIGSQVLGGGEYCRIELPHSRHIQLTAQHFLGPNRSEDRTPAFRAFVAALVAETRSADPGVPILTGLPPLIYWSWLTLFGTFTACFVIFIPLAVIGLIEEHKLSPATMGFMALVCLLAYGPFTFLRATWLRRPKPLGRELPPPGSAF